MSWQTNIQSAVRALRKEEAVLLKQLDVLQTKIEDLEGLSKQGAAAHKRAPSRRRLSPEGRAAISKAAKKRWQKYRSDKAKPFASSHSQSRSYTAIQVPSS
jgi:uncharacterized protein YdaU (DUF1376 family)